MVKSIISALGIAVSIISLAFSLPSWGKVVFVIVGIFSLLYLIYIDIIKSQENTIVCHNEDEIKKQMSNLINAQGSICIMSRDLSWVTPEIETLIIDKRDNMLIFAQHSTELTKRMSNNGVSIYLYGNIGFEPKTRFTIIRFNQDQPQVAISKPSSKLKGRHTYTHKIYQTASRNNDKDAWIISLSLDLMRLCEKAATREEIAHE